MTPDLEDEIEFSNCELCVTRREARGPSLNRHPGQERTRVLGCPERSTNQFVSYQHSFEINWHLLTPRKQAHTDLETRVLVSGVLPCYSSTTQEFNVMVRGCKSGLGIQALMLKRSHEVQCNTY